MAGFLLPGDFCLEKLSLCFRLCLLGFLQPRRSSGRNLSLSAYIVFVFKAIICNLPSPTNPKEPKWIKTYIAEACAAFLLPGKLTAYPVTKEMGSWKKSH